MYVSVSNIERGTHLFYNLLKCAPNIYTKSKYIRYRNITKSPYKYNKEMSNIDKELNNNYKVITYRNYSIVVNKSYDMT